MERLGLSPRAATSHAEAESALEAESFELILLDIDLPDGNGLDFHGQLAERAVVTPRIFVTSDDLAEDAVQAMRLGAADYIVKRPGYLEVVRTTVRELLQSRGREREQFVLKERSKMLTVLEEHRWNVSAAARSLGMSRGKLRGRMRTLGLD